MVIKKQWLLLTGDLSGLSHQIFNTFNDKAKDLSCWERANTGVMADTTLGSILFWSGIPFFITGFVSNVLVIRTVHKTRTVHTTTSELCTQLLISFQQTWLLAMSSPFWWGHYSISPISLDITVMDLEDSHANVQFSVALPWRFHLSP